VFSAQREVIQDLKRQLNDLEQEWQSSRARLEKCKQAVTRHLQREQDLKIEMQRLEDHAEALRDALDKDNAEDGRIEALRAALQEAEEEKSLNEGSYNDSQAAMSELMENLKMVRRELKAHDENIQTLERNSRVAQSENSQVESRRREIISDKNAAVAQIEDDKKDREKLKEKRDQASSTVLDYTEKASIVSTRVPVDEGETTHSLDQKLVRLQRDLERYNAE
jgi:chromosome segregation ATPase